MMYCGYTMYTIHGWSEVKTVLQIIASTRECTLCTVHCALCTAQVPSSSGYSEQCQDETNSLPVEAITLSFSRDRWALHRFINSYDAMQLGNVGRESCYVMILRIPYNFCNIVVPKKYSVFVQRKYIPWDLSDCWITNYITDAISSVFCISYFLFPNAINC